MREWLGVLPAAVVVLAPVVWLAGTLLGPGPVLSWDSTSALLLQRSVGLAGGATGVALRLGGPCGWWAARRRLPIGGLLCRTRFWPLLLPPYVLALAWNLLLARDGPIQFGLRAVGAAPLPWEPFRNPGVVLWTLAAPGAALCAWFAALAARSVPAELEEAARLELPEGHAALWAALPTLTRTLAVAALLVFLLALADFGAPNALGLPTYPVEIVNRFQIDRGAAGAVRFAWPLIAVTVPLSLLLARLLSALPVAPEGDTPPRVLRRGRGDWARAGWCGLFLGGTCFIPLAMLAAASLPLDTYRAVWEESADHLGNTLLTGGGAAGLAVTLALVAGWSLRDRRAAALDAAWTLPAALPASLIGIAMIEILNRPGLLEALYTSLAGLVWTHTALFFPFAYYALRPAWAHVDPALLDELAVAGAGDWIRFRVGAWPVLRSRAAAAAALVALLSSREVDATALIRIPGGDTIAFRIHDYLHFAPGPNLAALCILLFGIGVLALALGKLGRDLRERE